ncbi:MAG: amidophosphoribosyltransferase [Gammaproteobacteria bacterium]|nr:MAG: amidophosphoribosyltransferase [Gammaproteobacteria bacterium]
MNDFIKLATVCPRCALPLQHTQHCGHCLNNPPEQDLSISLYRYSDPIRQLILDFKYHNQLYLAPFFGQLLAQKIASTSQVELLIPIPLHPNRLKDRGYNQSHELAKSLSRQLNIPVNPHLLTRVIDTPSQSSMAFKDRKKNMRNAFKLSHHSLELPKHIAIIDDVLTTGHTANAAAKVFRKEGVATIEIWTIARTVKADFND